ncbi:MAG: hypothetical protein N0E48_26690 [Candidatus Thiodiazotropha endolucinida]|nr:hypothetical protein [Candidatus Thiodiazotropha taylori]MCW4346916.1 hypothetical protein [Candidatus Thiodiazotropha endolucinida]
MHSQKQKQDKQQSTIKGNNNNNNGNVIPWINELKQNTKSEFILKDKLWKKPGQRWADSDTTRQRRIGAGRLGTT